MTEQKYGNESREDDAAPLTPKNATKKTSKRQHWLLIWYLGFIPSGDRIPRRECPTQGVTDVEIETRYSFRILS